MTLHKTVEIARKFLLGVVVGVVILILLMLLFRFGIIIKNIFFPPKVQPANNTYGLLPFISFPQNVSDKKFTYAVNTLSGGLPTFPERLNVYPIKMAQPSLLNLNKAKKRAEILGFIDENSRVLPEKTTDGVYYQWQENSGISRKLVVNIITFDFTLSSNYSSSPNVLSAINLPDEKGAIETTKTFLNSINSMPDDIDMQKTQTQLLSIVNGAPSLTTSLSKAHLIRVDFYQKDVEYTLNTGIPELAGGFKKIKMVMPIVYPNLPYSTMNFLTASGGSAPQVVQTNFVHKTFEKEDPDPTYSIKTSQEAFEDLQNGKAYIAAYAGSQTNIVINKVYLAYYLADVLQEYLMPVVVFEGNDNFFAYVSAVKDEWVK